MEQRGCLLAGTVFQLYLLLLGDIGISFVVCLVVIVGYGIVHPIGEIGAVAVESSVGEGIINGYQTVDVFGAIGVMIIVIADINSRSYQNDKERTKVALIATAIAGVMLFFVFMGLTWCCIRRSLYRFFLSIFHMFEAGLPSGFDMAHIMYCVFLAGAMNAMDAF